MCHMANSSMAASECECDQLIKLVCNPPAIKSNTMGYFASDGSPLAAGIGDNGVVHLARNAQSTSALSAWPRRAAHKTLSPNTTCTSLLHPQQMTSAS